MAHIEKIVECDGCGFLFRKEKCVQYIEKFCIFWIYEYNFCEECAKTVEWKPTKENRVTNRIANQTRTEPSTT